MKVLLMHPDQDFAPLKMPLCDPATLAQDLELSTLWAAMSGDDALIADVVRTALFAGFENDLETVLHRQAVLRDCLNNPEVVRGLYALAGEVVESRRRHHISIFLNYPSSVLREATSIMEIMVGFLKRLRITAEEHAGQFASRGFATLFSMLVKELDDPYLGRIEEHLHGLKFDHGVLLSAQLDKGNRGTGYLVRKAKRKTPWWARFVSEPGVYTFQLHERDEAGAQALSEIEGRGINLVANALGQSADHILGFFETFRTELAFYIGCLNLHDRLAEIGEPICFPQPKPTGSARYRASGMYDVSLALQMKRAVVANDIEATGRRLVVITGANQGGKSSFLRAIGLAQMMLHSGMFIGANSVDGALCSGLFTHFKREEDVGLKSGKLDEELSRLSDIVSHISPGAMLLFNESFASTNEREGSEIARQIVCALLEKNIRVVFVTHFYKLAYDFYTTNTFPVLFLRAQRLSNGTRTFRMVEGAPEDTSYGSDLYQRIFLAESGKEGRIQEVL